MKLELKHLAAYLPYGLKLYIECNSEFDTNGFDHEFDENPIFIDGIREMTGINYENSFLPDCIMFKEVTKTNQSRDGYVQIENVKPILRPLSDLDKEITHDGKTFNPKFVIDMAFPSERMGLNPATWSHRVVTKLQEWHFDVFGLIDNGLAIDINTLKL
jgi:hypothetical protein